MALGKSDIAKCKESYNEILRRIPILSDCNNSFDYVTKNIAEWADETRVGQETRDNLAMLVSSIDSIIAQLNKYLQYVQNFITEQERANEGN